MMLFRVLRRSIERGCDGAAMLEKIDVFYAADRITGAEYAELVGLLADGNA